MIFLYPAERVRKPEGEWEGVMERKWSCECTEKKLRFTCCVCSLHVCDILYSTDTYIKTVVFFFCQKTRTCRSRSRPDSESLDDATREKRISGIQCELSNLLTWTPNWKARDNATAVPHTHPLCPSCKEWGVCIGRRSGMYDHSTGLPFSRLLFVSSVKPEVKSEFF